MEEVMKIARQASTEFYFRNFGVFDRAEIVSEAYLAMIKAIDTWNPERESSLKSWVGLLVKRRLQRVFLHSKKEPLADDIDIEQMPNKWNPEELLIKKERELLRKQKVTETSREILRLMQYGNFEITKKNETKRRIKTELKKQGHTCRNIKHAFQELKAEAVFI